MSEVRILSATREGVTKLPAMKTLWVEQEIGYDGTQLRSHWIYHQFGILGDACVAFVGPCDVPLAHMVDQEDVKNQAPIHSQRMLHFIAEFFQHDLTTTILLQRNLVSLAQQEIVFRSKISSIVRGGNDLYETGLKLSVSIATCSPVSTLIHFGLNVISAGTPVPTKGLEDYRIPPIDLAKSLLATFQNECETLQIHRAKVRAVP